MKWDSDLGIEDEDIIPVTDVAAIHALRSNRHLMQLLQFAPESYRSPANSLPPRTESSPSRLFPGTKIVHANEMICNARRENKCRLSLRERRHWSSACIRSKPTCAKRSAWKLDWTMTRFRRSGAWVDAPSSVAATLPTAGCGCG